MRITTVRLLLVPLVAVAAACASTPEPAEEGETSSSRNVITTAQLDGMATQSAYDVVRKLKPRWLQSRGPVSFRGRTNLLVVVDEGQFEGVGHLRSIRAGDVREIRYMDARRGMLKFGDQANGGVILVYMR